MSPPIVVDSVALSGKANGNPLLADTTDLVRITPPASSE